MIRVQALLCASLISCQQAPAYAAQPEAADAFEVFAKRRGDVSAADLDRQFPPPVTPALGFDPLKVPFFTEVSEALELTGEEKAKFKRHGMVSVDHGKHTSFGSSYYSIYARDLPVLITSDSIMHAVHRSYDDILMELEVAYFAPTIQSVLERVQEDVAGKNRDVALYAAVALNLLAGVEAAAVTDKGVDTRALKGILAKIKRLKPDRPNGGTTLMGRRRPIDWSQFKPRGHYTKSEELKRYFQTMMWLGRADTGFALKGPRREKKAMLRLVKALERSEGLKDLRAMDEVIGFMVGPSDNVTPVDVAEAMVGNPSDKVLLSRLAQKVGARQQIRSQIMVSDPDDPKEVPLPSVFQMFGQRFVIDSFVLSKVVFDSITYKGRKVKRMMPSGLDVMAALGCDQAIQELKPQFKVHPYAGNLLAARDMVDAQSTEFWEQSVYNRWLSTLRTLHDAPKSKNLPVVMRSEAWAQKQLRTQLGSWAELRHDTILYAKQSYSMASGCSYPAAYVEPYPEFYAGVRSLALTASTRLAAADFGKRDGLRSRHRAYFDRLATVAERLQRIAESELAANPMSKEDTEWLRKTIDERGGGSGPPRYDGWYPSIFYRGGSSASKWEPTVSDIHTDPGSKRVLQVGVGNVDFLVVAIDNESDRRVYVGPSYSFYEFTQPMRDRLTDEQWRARLSEGKTPPRPRWTDDWQGRMHMRFMNLRRRPR